MTEPGPPDDGSSEPSMPRWVKVGVAIALVLILILVIGKAAGMEHGPGQHSSPKSDSRSTTPSDGHEPPVDGHE